MPFDPLLLLLLTTSFLAGAMNVIAGGGTFIVFPTLLLLGLDARTANITCTIALFPGLAWAGWSGRRMVADAPQISFRGLLLLSLAGGLGGAVLLLATPSAVFARLVPWLVLFATLVFTWGSFLRNPLQPAVNIGRWGAGTIQSVIAVYGGYFGGGIGFLMLAVLAMTGMAVRPAAATKTVLAGAMNAAAVGVFLFSPGLAWGPGAVVALGALAGGQGGVWLIRRLSDRVLRLGVVAIGAALTIGLFIRG